MTHTNWSYKLQHHAEDSFTVFIYLNGKMLKTIPKKPFLQLVNETAKFRKEWKEDA